MPMHPLAVSTSIPRCAVRARYAQYQCPSLTLKSFVQSNHTPVAIPAFAVKCFTLILSEQCYHTSTVSPSFAVRSSVQGHHTSEKTFKVSSRSDTLVICNWRCTCNRLYLLADSVQGYHTSASTKKVLSRPDTSYIQLEMHI